MIDLLNILVDKCNIIFGAAGIHIVRDKAAEVNDVAYELLEDIEKEWLSEHKPKQANSLVEMYRLRTQARMIAEEVVLHDVVNSFR